MLDIRALLRKYQIDYRSEGRNVSRGQIVIACPFCEKTGDPDPGEHMVINPATGYFYCFRNPKHASCFTPKLLKALDIPREEYGDIKFKEEDDTPYVAETKNYAEWRYFESATRNQEALNYLSARLFEDPLATAQKFDLRADRQGQWAGRLLIPMYNGGWTGRAMRSHLEPRYLAWTNENGFFLYKQNASSVIILEGAIDAMRVASVSTQFDVIAKCRMVLSPAILAFLRDQNYMSIYTAPDASVPFENYRQEIRIIRTSCPYATVKRVEMPEGRKDFGETPESDTRRLLSSLGNYNELSTLRNTN